MLLLPAVPPAENRNRADYATTFSRMQLKMRAVFGPRYLRPWRGAERGYA